MAQTICVINQKGGVAKSTTSHNLAVALSQMGRKVLLVDLDPQHNLTDVVLPPDASFEFGSYELFSNWDNKLVCRVSDKLAIIPATDKLMKIESEVTNLNNRFFLLKNSLEAIKRHCSYIIIDCPPNLGLVTINAMAAADSIVIPTLADRYGFDAVTELYETVMDIRESVNPELNIAGVVFTRYRDKYVYSRDFARNIAIWAIEKKLNIFKTKITESVAVCESQAVGKSVIEYSPFSVPAQDYMKLARELENGLR